MSGTICFINWVMLQIETVSSELRPMLWRGMQAPLLFCAAIWWALIKSNCSHIQKRNRGASSPSSGCTEIRPDIKPDKIEQAVLSLFSDKGSPSRFHCKKCCTNVMYVLSGFNCKIPSPLAIKGIICRGKPKWWVYFINRTMQTQSLVQI